MSTTFDHTSLSFGAGGYSFATAHMAAQRRELLRRTMAERWRRYMLSVLDAAVDQCERCNLAAPDGITDMPPPELVVALIEQLQLELAKMQSLAWVESRAAQMGMRRPERSVTLHLDMPSDDGDR